MSRVAVIGGGLSGLAAANYLDGHEVTVFEKSRGTSGRLSTRYADPYRFDHGAQFFTARSPAFRAFVATLIDAGAVAEWSPALADIDGAEVTMCNPWSGEPHFVGVPGMNSIGQHLAGDLEVQCQTEVMAIRRRQRAWQLELADGSLLGPFDGVIVATPPQQARALIGAHWPWRGLGALQIQACFALMIGLDAPLRLPWQAARLLNSPIRWICQNNSKPGRRNAMSLVVHADNDWSDQHIDDDPSKVRQTLVEETSRVTGLDVRVANHIALHRWRYAKVRTGLDIGFLLDSENMLGACGDWCMDGRVEGAFNSGRLLAQSFPR